MLVYTFPNKEEIQLPVGKSLRLCVFAMEHSQGIKELETGEYYQDCSFNDSPRARQNE